MNRNTSGTPPWPQERVKRLRELFHEGLSCGAIAAALGSVSRNAVIGKLTRLGVKRGEVALGQTSRKAKRNEAEIARAPAARSAKPRAKPQKTVLVVSAPILQVRAPTLEGVERVETPADIGATRVSLLSATKHHCRWPAADDGSATMVCGGSVIAGTSYCARHSRAMFRRGVA
jgi:GcrA cell cycle regulator